MKKYTIHFTVDCGLSGSVITVKAKEAPVISRNKSSVTVDGLELQFAADCEIFRVEEVLPSSRK